MDSSQPDQQTRAILAAIGAVAKRNGLKRDWFHDAAFGILGGTQPPQKELTLWKTYEALELSIPPVQFILAVKLFGFRDRDYNDVQALLQKLHITEREQAQAIIDCSISRQAQHEYRTRETLDDLFEE